MVMILFWFLETLVTLNHCQSVVAEPSLYDYDMVSMSFYEGLRVCVKIQAGHIFAYYIIR